MSRLPNFLIVGAAKSGTTSLARYLGAHPDAFMAPEKELYFFERDHLWERGADWYAEQFAGAGSAAAVGEATPSYMYFPWVGERIAATLPGVRLIACLRHPVERAFSHYLHWRDRHVIEHRSFARAVEDELAAGCPLVRHDDADPLTFGYLRRGHYLEQLERLEGVVGRERLHVVLLDDLERDAAEAFAATCRFLGIDDGVRPDNLGERENAYIAFRPAWLFRFMVRHRLFKLMPVRVGKYLALDVMGPRPKSVPPIDPQARARLLEHFAPHNARLADWLGRDLAAWSS